MLSCIFMSHQNDPNQTVILANEAEPSMASRLVPIEHQQLDSSLDGTYGEFRVSANLPRMISANNDLEAIQEWLAYSSERSSATWRSYRKEAERLLAWSIVELGKPLSSLRMGDLVAYKAFLRNPQSRHPSVSWIAKRLNDENGQPTKRKRYRRSDPEWRPFDGPLKDSSVDYAMRVLKALFTYWTQTGYTQLNPLALQQKKTVLLSDKAKPARDRSLDIDTWRYLYQYIEACADEQHMPTGLTDQQRLRWLRTWYRAEVIFASLYLLGTRISELADLKMSAFSQRDGKDSEGQFTKFWWVKVVGKGYKEREIPAPSQLIEVIRKYRQFLNTFPHPSRRLNKKDSDSLGNLLELPSSDDESPLILSSTGLQGVTANRLYVIIKETMASAENHLPVYQAQCMKEDVTPLQVDANKLKAASSHWMRHTSATHQGLEGISLRHRQKSLGHTSIETTTIYDHGDNQAWASDVDKFKLSK